MKTSTIYFLSYVIATVFAAQEDITSLGGDTANKKNSHLRRANKKIQRELVKKKKVANGPKSKPSSQRGADGNHRRVLSTKSPSSIAHSSSTRTPSTTPPSNTPTVCDANQSKVVVSVTTDSYPSENTWQLSNSNGDFMNSGGPYTTEYATDETEMCIDTSNDCYTFEFFDSYGDGLLEGGSFSVTLDGMEIFSNHGTTSFDSLVTHIGATCLD